MSHSLWDNFPGGHVRLLLDRLQDPDLRACYAGAAVQYGWSRNVLQHHLATQLHRREGEALSNFTSQLPAPDSDLAQQLTRDPYVFEHLALTKPKAERELEQSPMDRLQETLTAARHHLWAALLLFSWPKREEPEWTGGQKENKNGCHDPEPICCLGPPEDE